MRARRWVSFVPATRPLLGWMAGAVLVAVWYLAARLQDDAILLPGPVEVATAAVQMAQSGEMWRHVAASLQRLLPGWVIGAGAGLACGIAIGLSPVVRSVALPLVNLLFALPKIALIPLFVVWLGIGEASKIATIAVGVFSPMAVATCGALDAVDRTLIRMAQSFGVPTGRIVWHVCLPGAVPGLITGVRVSGAVAIVLLVGAEMIGAQHGVGALALGAGSLMRTDRLFVALALLGCGGLIVAWVIGLAERHLLRWR